MIPLKLQLQNFMCYRDVEPLDFRGIQLACLAGDNGHGKSALLDAMTWALWGKARARRDDELIHLGEKEMEVEFEFALGGNDYRVIRKRDSRGRGSSSLEFQVQDNGQFRPLTESTMRKTQRRIINTLRMDYDTFINSAFLLQGRADEFTVKTPGERKRVLGEILGLEIYDAYEDRAKERAKEKDVEEREVEAAIREIDRELERKPEYEAELEGAEEKVAGLGEKLEAEEETLGQLKEKRQELAFKKKQIEELEERMGQAREELQELQEEIPKRHERVSQYESALGRAEEIEEGHATLRKARETNDALNEKLSQLVALNEEKSELQAAISGAKQTLSMEARVSRERIEELEGKAEGGEELEDQLAEVREELARLADVESEREERRAQIQDISQKIASLRTVNEGLKGDMGLLREKLTLLEGAEATCPLCGQPLSEDEEHRIAERYEAEGKEKGDAYRENQDRIKEMKGQVEELQEEIQAAEKDLARRPALQKREATLEKSLSEAQEAAEGAAEQKAKLAGIEKKLEQDDYASEEQERLAELLERRQELGYDAEAHETARQQITEFAEFEEAKRRLDEARERIEEEQAALAQAQKAQERWRASLAADEEKREALAEDVARWDEVQEAVEEARDAVDAMKTELSRARLELGAAQQKLAACDELAKQREVKVAEAQQIAEERAIYEELRVAFGKRGVQAMIIESSIPEIEDEANALLARMTNGRMHVRFETQREAKTTDSVIETLDINISDELGTRSYELYSGGEAFRVNFAIRIALSKLLARRAGARLRTLVIDEGFGTQDAQGRERLVQAINSISDDFEKILVITHIEELKDLFPARIDVFKTPSGSQISVS